MEENQLDAQITNKNQEDGEHEFNVDFSEYDDSTLAYFNQLMTIRSQQMPKEEDLKTVASDDFLMNEAAYRACGNLKNPAELVAGTGTSSHWYDGFVAIWQKYQRMIILGTVGVFGLFALRRKHE